MTKYKVVALSVGGLNKKIYNSGDIVTAENFPAGNAELLVKGGFLEEIKEKVKAEKPKSEKVDKAENKEVGE